MLGELALYFPVVRTALERAAQALHGRLPRPLGSYLFPPPAFTEEERRDHKAALTDTRIAQPALGAADLAALALLRSLGVDAELLAGHSYGEYVALGAAGVFSESGLLEVSAERGRLLAEPPDGVNSAMAAVGAPATAVAELLGSLPGVTLANHNSPAQCVISGRSEAIDAAVAALAARELVVKKIAVSAAFHSPLMEYAKAPLAQAVAAAVPCPPVLQAVAVALSPPVLRALPAMLLMQWHFRPVYRQAFPSCRVPCRQPFRLCRCRQLLRRCRSVCPRCPCRPVSRRCRSVPPFPPACRLCRSVLRWVRQSPWEPGQLLTAHLLHWMRRPSQTPMVPSRVKKRSPDPRQPGLGRLAGCRPNPGPSRSPWRTEYSTRLLSKAAPGSPGRLLRVPQFDDQPVTSATSVAAGLGTL